MKNTIKKSTANNTRFNQFQNFTIGRTQMRKVKGGKDILTEDIIQQ